MPFKHTGRHNDSLMRIQYLFIIPIVSQIYWTVVLHNAVLLTAKTFIPLRVQFIRTLHLTSSANHFKCPVIEIYYPFVNVYLTLCVSEITYLLLKSITHVIRDDIFRDIRLSANYNIPIKEFHHFHLSINLWILLLGVPLFLHFLFLSSRSPTIAHIFSLAIRIQFSSIRSFFRKDTSMTVCSFTCDFSLWLSQFFSQ